MYNYVGERTVPTHVNLISLFFAGKLLSQSLSRVRKSYLCDRDLLARHLQWPKQGGSIRSKWDAWEGLTSEDISVPHSHARQIVAHGVVGRTAFFPRNQYSWGTRHPPSGHRRLNRLCFARSSISKGGIPGSCRAFLLSLSHHGRVWAHYVRIVSCGGTWETFRMIQSYLVLHYRTIANSRINSSKRRRPINIESIFVRFRLKKTPEFCDFPYLTETYSGTIESPGPKSVFTRASEYYERRLEECNPYAGVFVTLRTIFQNFKGTLQISMELQHLRVSHPFSTSTAGMRPFQRLRRIQDPQYSLPSWVSKGCVGMKLDLFRMFFLSMGSPIHSRGRRSRLP